MPTDTFSISAAGNDGCGYRESSLWATIAAGAFTEFSGDASNSNFVEKIDASTIFYATCSFLRFDTSALNDAATISAATLELYVVARSEGDNYSLVADYYDFGGEPTVAGDWIETASPSVITATDISGLTLGAVNSIAFTDLTGISKTGITGVRLTFTTGEPTTTNSLEIAAQEHASRQEPRLLVTYTVASGSLLYNPRPRQHLRSR